MRSLKPYILFTVIILFALACTEIGFSQPYATQTLQPTFAHIYTLTHTPLQTSAPPTFVLPTSSIPLWITDFIDPILTKIAEQTPGFHDEFTSQLNKGWFYRLPDSDVQPFYAHLSNNALILQLPDGLERHDAMVYNPKLAQRNFVLSLDFKFGKTEPDDVFRFQFQSTPDQNVIVDLSKSEALTFRWSLSNNVQMISGTYDYFSPEFIKLVILIQENRCAILLNDAPLGYLDDCRVKPISQPDLQAVSLHLLSASGNSAEVTIDNVKLWDLDGLSSTP